MLCVTGVVVDASEYHLVLLFIGLARSSTLSFEHNWQKLWETVESPSRDQVGIKTKIGNYFGLVQAASSSQ